MGLRLLLVGASLVHAYEPKFLDLPSSMQHAPEDPCYGAYFASSSSDTDIVDSVAWNSYLDCKLLQYEGEAVEKVMYLGDSNMDYWASSYGVGVNVGASGATCFGVDKHAQKVLDAVHPETVILHCGTNDIWAEQGVEATFASLQSVLAQLLAFPSVKKVLYISTVPEPGLIKYYGQGIVNLMHMEYNAYDALVKQAVAGNDRVQYLDAHNSFLAAGNPLWLYAADEMHLSEHGYDVFEALVSAANKDGCAYLICSPKHPARHLLFMADQASYIQPMVCRCAS
mmetsp:Transcript_10685/g.17923  ORF Transcript_10685/g.17923 Transcript_10685/m.17923 type:complete len:283 (+) Transcript_10685:108-956(+)